MSDLALLGEHERALAIELAPLFPFEPHVFARKHQGGVAHVHHVDEGPRSDEAVLFLHGNPTWSFAWRAPIAALSATRRCVAPDMVGCGLSDKPQNFEYVLERHVETVEQLVAHLGLTRIHLVVHDWGGAIGMGFARRHPERIASITALNTAAFTGGRIPRRIAMLRAPMLGEWAMRRLGVFERAALFMTVARSTRVAKPVARGYVGPYHDWRSRIAVARFVQDIPLDASHPSFGELDATGRALATFDGVPTQLIWGERDWCFTTRFLDEWRRRLPSARVHSIPDAGHYVFEDAAEEVVAVLTRFLDEVAAPRAAVERGVSRHG